jgi:hypothetical protein
MHSSINNFTHYTKDVLGNKLYFDLKTLNRRGESDKIVIHNDKENRVLMVVSSYIKNCVKNNGLKEI